MVLSSQTAADVAGAERAIAVLDAEAATLADTEARLTQAGILRQIGVGRSNRAFEAPEVIEAFTALERQLASPGGDTRISYPARRVPRRH